MTQEPDKELWQQFAKGARAYKIVDFPRYDEQGKSIGKICLRTLLEEELLKLDESVCEDVDNHFKNDTKVWNENSSIIVQRYNDRKEILTTHHYLQQVLVYPDNKNKLVYPTPVHVAGGITRPEAIKLMLQYYALQEGRPNFTNLSADQFNHWIDLLTKSIKADNISFLGRLEPETLIEFTIYLVNALSNSSQASSSLSKQLESFMSSGKQDGNLPTTE